MCECIENLIKTITNTLNFDISDLIALGALAFSVFSYTRTVKRDIKLSTIKEFNELRNKYPDINVEDDEQDNYLRDIERFSVAVNKKIYDIDIINRMSGDVLLYQYESLEKCLESKSEKYYTEYRKFISNLVKKRKRLLGRIF